MFALQSEHPEDLQAVVTTRNTEEWVDFRYIEKYIPTNVGALLSRCLGGLWRVPKHCKGKTISLVSRALISCSNDTMESLNESDSKNEIWYSPVIVEDFIENILF